VSTVESADSSALAPSSTLAPWCPCLSSLIRLLLPPVEHLPLPNPLGLPRAPAEVPPRLHHAVASASRSSPPRAEYARRAPGSPSAGAPVAATDPPSSRRGSPAETHRASPGSAPSRHRGPACRG